MLIPKFSTIDKYYILPIVLGIGQFSGINIYFSTLIIGALSLILTLKVDKQMLLNNKEIIQFVIFSIIISLINSSNKTPDYYSLLVWGQFFFIALVPLIIKNNSKLLISLMHIVLVLFLLDLFVNLIILTGINIPGIIVAEPRPGELFPRMQGIMNSNLFSSSISFLCLCFILDQTILSKHKYFKYLLLIFIIINIVLSGANRTIILALVIIFIRLFPSFRRSYIKNIGLILTVISIVIFLTFSNAFTNKSNLLRSQLWLISIDKIIQKPILGYGIYFPDASKVISSIESLSEMVVTESFILAIAYSFGLISILYFLYFIFKQINKASKNHDYIYQYGIFLGLSIELFFGGTLSNTLSTFIYFLSAYTIIENDIPIEYPIIHPLRNSSYDI